MNTKVFVFIITDNNNNHMSTNEFVRSNRSIDVVIQIMYSFIFR